MKAKQLIEKLLENWPVKLICLIIAIFLYIFHQTSLVDKKSFVLPLEVISNGSYVPVNQFKKNVTVVVRATTEDITSVHPSQIHASINLDSITSSGEYTLPVYIQVDEELMTFDPFEVKVKPESLKLKVEKKDIRYVQVEPSIVGEVAHGYELKDILVTPSYVEIEGPVSALQNVQSVKTSVIDITDAVKDIKKNVEYRDINKVIEVVDKGPYEVNVIVEVMRMERLFENVEIVPVNLKDNLILSEPLPAITYTLSGTVPLLEKYTPGINAASVNFANITEPGTYELPIKISIPGYYNIEQTSIQNVTATVELVTVEETPVTEEVEKETEETKPFIDSRILPMINGGR